METDQFTPSLFNPPKINLLSSVLLSVNKTEVQSSTPGKVGAKWKVNHYQKQLGVCLLFFFFYIVCPFAFRELAFSPLTFYLGLVLTLILSEAAEKSSCPTQV